jgi:hypothetical protein
MKTAVALIFEKFNLLSDKDFKSWMLNNHDELFEMEKEQIINARDTAPYSMFERIGEAENYYNQTFKSE